MLGATRVYWCERSWPGVRPAWMASWRVKTVLWSASGGGVSFLPMDASWGVFVWRGDDF